MDRETNSSFVAEIWRLHQSNPHRWKEMLDKAIAQEACQDEESREAKKAEWMGLEYERSKEVVLPELYMRLAIAHDVARKGRGFALILDKRIILPGHWVELKLQKKMKFAGYDEEGLQEALLAVKQDLSSFSPSVEQPEAKAATATHKSKPVSDAELINRHIVQRIKAYSLGLHYGRGVAAGLRHGVRKANPQDSSAKNDAGKSEGQKDDPRVQNVVLKHWTQHDLDNAIRDYKAKRAASYANLVDAIRDKKKGALKAARELFGRNVIVKALGVRSPIMVSRSPAWLAIAKELKFTLARDRRAKGTSNTNKPGRIGEGIAEEKVARKAYEDEQHAEEEYAPTKKKAIAIINKLPEVNRPPLLEALESGKQTPAQVVETAKALAKPVE